MTKTRITADVLRELPDEEVQRLLTELGPQKAEELKYDWSFWAREGQLLPTDNKDPRLVEKGLTKTQWNTWVCLAGRGWGKTKAGVETVREWVKQGNGIIHCVAPTKGDVRKVMVEGDSGLLNVCWKGDKTHRGAAMGYPNWSPTNNTLTWENGAKAVFFSAEDPERLRGPQAHKAWCFIAGTKVLTNAGEAPVEGITVGTLVQTSKGIHPVVATSKRPMTVGQVVFSDGRTLTGTYDHPIMTEGGQWVPLGDLEWGDKVCAIDVLSSKERRSTATAGDTTSGPGTTAGKVTRGLSGCIGLFGRALWDRSLRGIISITRTVTGSTTTSTTSNASLVNTTAGTTTLNEVVSQGSQNPTVSSNALIATQRSLGSRLSTAKTWFVSLVALKGLKRSEKPSEAAASVVRHSDQGLETTALSVVSTWRPRGEQYVYNLQVDEVHEYIANGVLTHNCDEICAWNNAQDTWDMMQFGLRLGQHPQTLVTTTPKTTKLIRNILADDKTIISRGSTYDNAANLAGTFLEAVRKQYEGTRLGRQELYAEILDEASGALWSRSLLASCEVDREDVPDLNRIVVSLDPAITSNAESDMTGIVVAGVDINGTAYVLEDATGRYTPQQWASKAVELYNRYEADRVVAEKNQGGDMVKHTLLTECPTLPIRLVHASRGKMARAEPVSALYEQGRVKHVKGLNELEDQMVTWEPLGSLGSPDRLDSLVWSITDLLLNGYAKPAMQLAYAPAVGLARR